MNADRYEIEPRPEALGGGWNLHVFGKDPETGESVEVGGGVFPVEPSQDPKYAYTDALETAQDWMAVDEAVESIEGSQEKAVFCADCSAPLKHEVLHSAAGFYIGTRCECGPYSRESYYYRTKAAAAADLAAGKYTQPQLRPIRMRRLTRERRNRRHRRVGRASRQAMDLTLADTRAWNEQKMLVPQTHSHRRRGIGEKSHNKCSPWPYLGWSVTLIPLRSSVLLLSVATEARWRPR